jgi:hypothetical protein
MIMVKKALEANKIPPFSAYARTTTKSAQLQRTKREAREAKQLEQQKRDDGGETKVAATVEQQHDDGVSSAVSVNTGHAQTSSEMATNLASIMESSINQEQLPESSSSATWSHDDAQTKGHEVQEDDTGATKPSSPRKDTKGKEPMASTKTSTKTPSHDDDTIKDQSPKRTITTRSMTRTRDQQKEKMAKSSRGSTTSTTTTTTTTSTTEHTVLATTEKKSTRTTTKAGKRGSHTATDNIGESSRPTKKKKSNPTRESSQQTRRLRPRDKGANKS